MFLRKFEVNVIISFGNYLLLCTYIEQDITFLYISHHAFKNFTKSDDFSRLPQTGYSDTLKEIKGNLPNYKRKLN